MHITRYYTILSFNNPDGKKCFENIVQKGENAGNHNVFYPIKETNHDVSIIWFVWCKCFLFGQIQSKLLLCIEEFNCNSNILKDFLFVFVTGARKMCVWNREGIHHSTSENVDGIEQALSWKYATFF